MYAKPPMIDEHMDASNNIGVIAGGGQFPLLFIEAARKDGKSSVVIGFKGETDAGIESVADEFCHMKLGQVGKAIRFFKKHGVSEVVFLGTIKKTRIFRDVIPDLKGLSVLRRIDKNHDDALLRAIAEVFEEDGIRIIESTRYLKKLLFPAGVLTRNSPSSQQYEDIAFGWKMAKAIGALDIGQCVVVRDKTVLAVEAIDGTDATILRGGLLCKEKAVIVKAHKPNQDFRFDLPATGLTTIENIKKVKGAVLAVEAGKSLMFDGKTFIQEADRAGIVVVGIREDGNGNIVY